MTELNSTELALSGWLLHRVDPEVREGIFHVLKMFSGEGNGNPLQYSCLENPMDGGAWCATVHGVAKSRTRLSNFTHSKMFRGKIFEKR